jgi:hypothetical protein
MAPKVTADEATVEEGFATYACAAPPLHRVS